VFGRAGGLAMVTQEGHCSQLSGEMLLRYTVKQAQGKTMLGKTVLNRFEQIKSFVSGSVAARWSMAPQP